MRTRKFYDEGVAGDEKEKKVGEFGGFDTLDELIADNESKGEAITAHDASIAEMQTKVDASKRIPIAPKDSATKAFPTKARDAYSAYANDPDIDISDLDTPAYAKHTAKLTRLLVAADKESDAELKIERDALQVKHETDSRMSDIRKDWDGVQAKNPKLTTAEKKAIVDRSTEENIMPSLAHSLINREASDKKHEAELKKVTDANKKSDRHEQVHTVIDDDKAPIRKYPRNSRMGDRESVKIALKDEKLSKLYVEMEEEKVEQMATN